MNPAFVLIAAGIAYGSVQLYAATSAVSPGTTEYEWVVELRPGSPPVERLEPVLHVEETSLSQFDQKHTRRQWKPF